MSEKTHADIIAEMRIFKCRDLSTGELEECTAISKYLADRIEAAHKREMDGLKKQVGSAAKLRDALVQVQKKINYLIGNLTVPNSLVANRMEINGIINAALAAPARNCDVGTTEEQSARMRKFCSKNGLCRDGSYRCENCGFLYDPNCELSWAQMPYEPEEGSDR